MRNFAKIHTVFSLLLFLFTSPTTADITSVKIRSDNRHLIQFKEFGFTQNGHISIAISSVSVTSTPVNSSLSRPADPSRIGFFLISEDAILSFQRERYSCDLDSSFISLLFTFRDLSPPPQSSFNKSYAVTNPNLYRLRFVNCNPLSHVTMDVRTEFYNTNNGTIKDYLSAGLSNLPSLYFSFSLIYLCVLGFWIFICFRNHQSFYWIHLLMGVLLVMKGLNLFCAAEVQHYVKVTGFHPYKWDVLLYIFQFFRIVLLYTVIGVTRTKKVLMVVIPLQILATVVSVRGERNPLYTDSFNLDLLLRLINCFCICFTGMFLHIWEPYETDQASGNYSGKLMRKFHIRGIAYLFIDLIMEMIAGYIYHWVSNAANEIASLLFYMWMLYMFRPFEKNKYLVQLILNVQVARAPDEELEL